MSGQADHASPEEEAWPATSGFLESCTSFSAPWAYWSALGLLLPFGGIAGVIGVTGEGDPAARAAIPILGLVGGVVFVVVLVLSIPGVVAGIGLLQYREWARILTIVLSALDLVTVPFGRALGIYGLWVPFRNETIQLFQHPPARQYPAYR